MLAPYDLTSSIPSGLSSTSSLVGSTLLVVNGSHKLSSTGDYAFSYIYDNALTGNSRVLTDCSAGPEYINLNVVKNGVGNGLTIRPTGIKSTALAIRSETTDNALTIQNSAWQTVCSIDNNGNISCGARGVLTTASGYTQSQTDNKIAAVTSTATTDTADITVVTL